MAWFLCGFFTGGIFLFVVMALCAAAGRDDRRRDSEFGEDIEVVNLEDG